MPASAKAKAHRTSSRGEHLSDEALLDIVQRQAFRYFWEGAHPGSGLARDRSGRLKDPADDAIAIGGSGFGVMVLIVASARQWVTRKQALDRLSLMLDRLEPATCYHGLYPHFMHGDTGATLPFSRKDDGADLVESAFLFQGLLCARAYFDSDTPGEKRLRDRIGYLWSEAEWDWYTQGGKTALTWHWSANNGFALNHPVRGWNECLIAYILAASAPRYSVPAEVYHEGWAQGREFVNRRTFEGVELPLGPDWGGPLFFTHYSFSGVDPRGLSDNYADYWAQNVSHTRINYAYCVRNPHGYKGYGPNCWGLTAGDSVRGYVGHAPDHDVGVITPSAALSSFVYAPEEAMAALRHFYEDLGDWIWGRYGFVDGFSEQYEWRADSYLAISQGPIVVMIENYRSGLIWNLFMGIPEIQAGMKKLGFKSPHFDRPAA
ncbi:MAG: glucoamylase family protein [Roseiarcus sp.]|uniref:glucoamylase family protein n=1 Tax=Roseiarcus sp. TaxID=1969460 RepID=UPI003BB0F699